MASQRSRDVSDSRPRSDPDTVRSMHTLSRMPRTCTLYTQTLPAGVSCANGTCQQQLGATFELGEGQLDTHGHRVLCRSRAQAEHRQRCSTRGWPDAGDHPRSRTKHQGGADAVAVARKWRDANGLRIEYQPRRVRGVERGGLEKTREERIGERLQVTGLRNRGICLGRKHAQLFVDHALQRIGGIDTKCGDHARVVEHGRELRVPRADLLIASPVQRGTYVGRVAPDRFRRIPAAGHAGAAADRAKSCAIRQLGVVEELRSLRAAQTQGFAAIYVLVTHQKVTHTGTTAMAHMAHSTARTTRAATLRRSETALAPWPSRRGDARAGAIRW